MQVDPLLVPSRLIGFLQPHLEQVDIETAMLVNEPLLVMRQQSGYSKGGCCQAMATAAAHD